MLTEVEIEEMKAKYRDKKIKEVEVIFQKFTKTTGNLQQEAAAHLTLCYFLSRVEAAIADMAENK